VFLAQCSITPKRLMDPNPSKHNYWISRRASLCRTYKALADPIWILYAMAQPMLFGSPGEDRP
jgi:hypothetical protein